MNQLLTVSEAAARLGVNRARVRALIASGQLRAGKIGGQWLLDPIAVDARQDLEIAGGRPFSPRNAWAILWLATASENELEPWDRHLSNRIARWRVRERLSQKPVGQVLAELAPRLRTRGRLHRLRAHPSDLPRILQEPDLVRTGLSAATDYGADIVASSIVEAYVPEDRLPALQQAYLLEPSSSPNVFLRTIRGFWPFPNACHAAPPAAVAVDLLDADDERTRRAGRDLLSRLGKRPA